MNRQAGWDKACFCTVYNVLTRFGAGRSAKTRLVPLVEGPLSIPLRQAASTIRYYPIGLVGTLGGGTTRRQGAHRRLVHSGQRRGVHFRRAVERGRQPRHHLQRLAGGIRLSACVCGGGAARWQGTHWGQLYHGRQRGA